MTITYHPPTEVSENPDLRGFICLEPTWSDSGRAESVAVTYYDRFADSIPISVWEGSEIEIDLPQYPRLDHVVSAMAEGTELDAHIRACCAAWRRTWNGSGYLYSTGECPERAGFEELAWPFVREWADEIAEFLAGEADARGTSEAAVLADTDAHEAMFASWREDAEYADTLMLGDVREAFADHAADHAAE